MRYGSTAAHSGDAALGMQSHLFYYALRFAAVLRAREQRSLESGVPNAQPAEPVEHVLHCYNA
jgi:hypothetical protein